MFVGRVCLSVCLLLAKITILASMLVGHVCLSVCLLLAKITVLASMLVGRRVCLSVCLFVTCQNLILASMFVGRVCLSVCLFVCLFVCTEISQNLRNLPKFDFGKYVRWSCLSVCLSVCYLPKFTFWQVCSLVVFVTCQNYILASMFVGRVCLFVCLYGNFTKSQERLSQSSPNLVTSKH